jgi:hypothetical protein
MFSVCRDVCWVLDPCHASLAGRQLPVGWGETQSDHGPSESMQSAQHTGVFTNVPLASETDSSPGRLPGDGYWFSKVQKTPIEAFLTFRHLLPHAM